MKFLGLKAALNANGRFKYKVSVTILNEQYQAPHLLLRVFTRIRKEQ